VGQGKQSISLEPGGQFELSGAPLETLHQTCAEVNSHLYQVGEQYTLSEARTGCGRFPSKNFCSI